MVKVCPLGPNYLPSYAGGVRAGLRELAPKLIGENPLEIGKLNERWDYLLKGHPYVKTGLDEACWDILGKVCYLLFDFTLNKHILLQINNYFSVIQIM